MFQHRPTQKAILLALLTVACYLPALQGTWLFDDRESIVSNVLITEPGHLDDIWFSTRPIDYWPVSYTAFWVQWRLWGENHTAYHVVNLALHIAAAWLAWAVLHRLQIPGAWTIALLFAVHPVNVETAAWIFQQKTTLAAAGFLASLWLWLIYDDSRRRLWLVASVVLFVLAMLAKTSAVALPPILLCVAWWRRGRIHRADVYASAPFFVAALVLGLVSVWFQTYRVVGDIQVREDGALGRLAGAGWALWFYLGKALWPTNLSFVYPKWHIDGTSLVAHLPLVAWLVATACFWRYQQRCGRSCLLACAWFVLTLAPVLGFVNIGYMRYSLVADHWQYLALLAPLTLVVGSAFHLANAHRHHLVRYAPGMVAVAIAMSCVISWRQAHAYRSQISLWTDTIAKNPTAWLARNNLSLELARQNELPAAEDGLREALRLLPGDPTIQSNLAMVLCRRHKFDEAISLSLQSLQQRPADAGLHVTLGMAHAGKFQDQDALHWLQKALQLAPDNASAHLAMGQLSLRQGRFTPANASFQRAIEFDDKKVDAYVGLAQALASQRRVPEARAQLQHALKLDPAHAEAHLQMANLLATEGHTQDAARLVADAVQQHPRNAALQGALAERLASLGQYQEAWQHARQALELDPNVPEIHASAADVLAALGRTEEAVNHYRRAVEINPRLADAHKALGGLLAGMGQSGEAIHHYRAALLERPTLPAVSSHLAWLLAMQPGATDAEKREALTWAQQACRETNYEHPVALDTLSIVYAALGQMEAATDAGVRARQRALALGQHDFARDVQQRLDEYQGRMATGPAATRR